MSLFWSKLMEQLLGGIKDERVSVSILVFIIAAAYYSFTWANDEFVNKAEFNELKVLMVDHTEEFRIVTASQIIRDLKTDLRIAKATAAPEAEIERLEDNLDHAEQYKRCLVDRQPNCEHILEQ